MLKCDSNGEIRLFMKLLKILGIVLPCLSPLRVLYHLSALEFSNKPISPPLYNSFESKAQADLS